MTVTIERLKQSLRIDGTADDDLLSVYLSSAQKNLSRPIGCAVDDPFLANNPEFDTAVLMLAGHYWSHRLAASDVSLMEIPQGLDSLYWPLKLDYAIQREGASDGSNTHS